MSQAASEAKEKFLGLVQRKHDNETIEKLKNVNLHPHDSVIASLLHRMFVERASFALVVAICLGMITVQKCENADLRQLLQKPYAFMIPSHIPDVIKVRANTIPDESVFTFAQEMASQLGNTNWEDAEDRYNDLKKYMHPVLREKFSREMRDHLKLWQTRKIDQKFTFKKPTKFDRKKERVSAGSSAVNLLPAEQMNQQSADLTNVEGEESMVFTVEIWGTVRKYIEGRPTDPYSERMTLKFTTNSISQDRWWLFELVDIKRESAQEIHDNKLISK
jgi:hypothetical protein